MANAITRSRGNEALTGSGSAAAVAKMKVAYVVSSSFSGSTLLALILNAHPAIGTISEFAAMDDIARKPDFRCSCGQNLRECAFFVQLRDEIKAKGLAFEIDDMDLMLHLHGSSFINRILCDKPPALNSFFVERLRDRIVDLMPWYRREKLRVYARNDAMIETVLNLQRASMFLDANKNPYRMLFLSQRYDLKALYLFKNGIAGVYSFLKGAARRRVPLTIERATRRWFLEQMAISRCLKRLGDGKCLQVGYSDLCNDPTATLARICEFLEIEPLPLGDFAKAPHHVIGNAMRLGDFSTIRETTDWRDNLSQSDVEEYRRACRKYLPRLRAVNPTIIDHLWL